MAVNFYKNHDDIVAAYKEVLDPKCKTNWALFGYEKQTSNLMFLDKGDGGLDELYNEFSQSKILYAFCEAKDENSPISRYILINWQGECAPLSRKGICMNHFSDISNFFKGYHVVLNARCEEDVEPAALMEHVSKLSSRIKFDKSDQHLENERNTVGTNYKRIVPQNEISQSARESFWETQKKEEEARLRENKEKIKACGNQLDIASVKRNESPPQPPIKTNQSNQLRRERIDEAKSLISKSSVNSAKAFFEQNSAASQVTGETGPRTINIRESIPTPIKKDEEAPPIVANIKEQVNGNLNGHTRKEEEEEIDDFAERVVEEAHFDQGETNSKELIDEEMSRDEPTNFTANASAHNQYYFPEQRILENIEEEHVDEDGEVLTVKDEAAISQGLQAKALYDYQAADDTEISFDPDDIITHIEQIDEGWWQGLAPNGVYGLFPANYVELIN